MDKNKKSPSPTQTIEPLPLKKISNLSKINATPPTKKINNPNLHDLERFHSNYACSLSTL